MESFACRSLESLRGNDLVGHEKRRVIRGEARELPPAPLEGLVVVAADNHVIMQYDTILTSNNAHYITNLTYTQGVASFIALLTKPSGPGRSSCATRP